MDDKLLREISHNIKLCYRTIKQNYVNKSVSTNSRLQNSAIVSKNGLLKSFKIVHLSDFIDEMMICRVFVSGVLHAGQLFLLWRV
jgi:hypothetical protein